MIGVVGGNQNLRRLRLVTCACARRLGELLDTPRIWQVLDTVEDLAGAGYSSAVRLAVLEVIEDVRASLLHDRSVVPEWMIDDPDMAEHASQYTTQRLVWGLDAHPIVWAARALEVVMFDYIPPEPLCRAIDTLRRVVDPGDRELLVRERKAQCDVLRDVFGNPFRPVSFSPDWRTDTAVSLARTMYDAREFSAMPILADALQDAGCDNEHILSHCRDGNSVHVRGCWMVDLVLGKN